MKRVVTFVAVAMAAFLLSVSVKAQDLNEIIDLFNKANQEMQSKSYDQALANINKVYEMANTIGDAEGEELATIKNNCEKLLVGIPYLQGKDYLAAKEYDKAVEKLSASRVSAEKFGDNDVKSEVTELLPKIYMAKGTDLLSNNDFANAIVALKKSLELNPANADAHFMMAYAYDKLDDEANSIGSYEKTIEVAKAAGDDANVQKANAQLSVIFVKKAQAAMQAKKYAEAITLAKKSNEYNESFNAYFIAGVSALQAKRADEAISNLEKATTLNNNPQQQIDIDYYLATQYDTKGNKAKACANYKKAMASPKYKANAEARVKALGC